jgi:hypothetical protein
MASAVATDKIACNWFIKNYDHDPGTNAVKVISADGGTTEIWHDMKDYDSIAYLLIVTAGTTFSGTLLEIVASEAADEGDASVTQIKTSGAITVNSLAKGAFVECSAEEVAAACTATYPNLRYVSARVTLAGHANDNEGQVVVFAHANKPHDAVTAATW